MNQCNWPFAKTPPP